MMTTNDDRAKEMRVLVLHAHPAPRRSRVNAAMLAAARGVEGVTVRELYEEYPDFFIDVKAEQEVVAAHDVVVMQHPFYWYATPALVKEWFDLVLTPGWAYGEGGTALRGKRWMHAVSTGGRRSRTGRGVSMGLRCGS
jgi:glutathione-regulated potassium-efflux system ancillary protein KefG